MLGTTFRSLLAALSLYTRLPAWRCATLSQSDYAKAIHWWPYLALLTNGLMLVVYALAQEFYPSIVAVVLALLARVLMTGAFHEDGLGDVCDGFGGGRSRDRILEIMKDSQVGSYAVVGYVLYYLLLTAILLSFPYECLASAFLLSGVLARHASAQQIRLLPYARVAEESKIGFVYEAQGRYEWLSHVLILVFLPMLWLSLWQYCMMMLALGMAFCVGLFYLRRRLGGYTGDTLGAGYLLLELYLLFVLYLFVTC